MNVEEITISEIKVSLLRINGLTFQIVFKIIFQNTATWRNHRALDLEDRSVHAMLLYKVIFF